MRIACLGGGPAGLYFAIAMKLRDPAHDITVVERNRPDDTFGWGVVLSDETLANLEPHDPVSAEAIAARFVYWDDIAVHYRGTIMRSSGHGFCGIGRKRLLNHSPGPRAGARRRAAVRDRSPTSLRTFSRLRPDRRGRRRQLQGPRTALAERLQARHRGARQCKYVWLGTHKKFDDAFTFIFEETEHGWIWVHAYQFDPETATFIVECSEGDLAPSSASSS